MSSYDKLRDEEERVNAYWNKNFEELISAHK